MRVLHLLKTSTGAGWALQQTSELVKLGIEVHVALPPGGPRVDAYRKAGVQVHLRDCSLPTLRPSRFPAVARSLRELVESVQPDVIHSHFVTTTLCLRLALGKHHQTPRLFQVPGPLHLEHLYSREADLRTAGDCDRWVASCQWTYDRYARAGVPATRRFLSYYGTTVDMFAGEPVCRLRSDLSLRAATRIVGMVAYMYPPKRLLGQARGLKGHEDLVDAAALCLERGVDLVCVFVGGAWNGAARYEARIRTYASDRLGRRAVFLGNRPDVANLYPAFDVAVHPSLSENLGGAAESMLAGIPTIATNVGGFPDLITHGETGWLVPARSPHQLAATLGEVLADPAAARRCAAAGRIRARGLLDVRLTALQMARIYNAICTPGPSPATAPSGIS